MGIDLYLIKDDKIVADLGRAHNYQTPEKNNRLHFTKTILAHLCYQPKDQNELTDIIDQIVDAIDYLYDNAYRHGQINLLNQLKKQGFEILTDVEWEERQQIKDKPDYIEPDF